LSGNGEQRDRADASSGQGLQVGDNNVQFNFFEKYTDLREAAQAQTVVVGDVPHEPAAFQPRAGLMESLGRKSGDRVSVVFAVTGIRGVGKTQVAAAYARWRIRDQWRLVAWVDATDEASVLAGLAQVAVAAGVGPAGEDAWVLAAGVRHWLEADGERRLVVFDNAVELDVLRQFLPAAGSAQVIVTSSRRAAEGLGRSVQVDVFSEGEALAFLSERTGLEDPAGARELAGELGFLPLGLAQAAALIAREHLSYETYLGRLRGLPVAGYLKRVDGDAYPYRLAEAIILSLRAVEDRDSSGVCRRLMGLVAVLAETGVPRRLLHLAAVAQALGGKPEEVGETEADAAAGVLADASLLGFTTDDSVVAHRLVMRVARERLAAAGELTAVLAGAVRTLVLLTGPVKEAWRDPGGIREVAVQVNALVTQATAYPYALPQPELWPRIMLFLRLRSLRLLNELGDNTGLAILAAEPLVADSERVLGADHDDTLSARAQVGHAYKAAGRVSEAVLLFERTLADCERLRGTDHPDTHTSRNDLALAYVDAGRRAEAISLLERTLADRERLLGTDHRDTIRARAQVGHAYRAAGRMAEAIALLERTLADSERLLGTDDLDTLGACGQVGIAYLDAGRMAEAIALLERTLADSERLLGTDHPSTLTSRGNLAFAYQDAGRMAEAIALLERTLADYERLLGTDHTDTLAYRACLAVVYGDAGRIAEAIALLERTLADCERVLGREHPTTNGLRGRLANWKADARR
jgi:tetratricopeptide (TPR) repeat protein